MADIVLIAVLIAFFSLAALFVAACDRIIGPDADVVPVDEPTELERAAA